MRTIMVMNPKGGSGKSTVAMNLATYYADEGENVAIADYDPQGSCIDWLKAREDYSGIPKIAGIAAYKGKPRIPAKTDLVILDAPARTHGAELTGLLRHVDTIVMPVMPSPIDMRAAAKYIDELRSKGHVKKGKAKIGLLANRVRKNTTTFRELKGFLDGYSVPVIGSLRDSQVYIKAAETGLGIFELPPFQTKGDISSWIPILDWLDSKASMPKA